MTNITIGTSLVKMSALFIYDSFVNNEAAQMNLHVIPIIHLNFIILFDLIIS